MKLMADGSRFFSRHRLRLLQLSPNILPLLEGSYSDLQYLLAEIRMTLLTSHSMPYDQSPLNTCRRTDFSQHRWCTFYRNVPQNIVELSSDVIGRDTHWMDRISISNKI